MWREDKIIGLEKFGQGKFSQNYGKKKLGKGSFLRTMAPNPRFRGAGYCVDIISKVPDISPYVLFVFDINLCLIYI